jgi:hypothetical protein
MVGAVTCFALSFSVIKWPGTSGAVIAWWRLVVSAGDLVGGARRVAVAGSATAVS